jgi:hypothetical protein
VAGAGFLRGIYLDFDILASLVNAVSEAVLALCDDDAVVALYSRFRTMLVAAGVLWLELFGRSGSDNLVLLSAYHAPAITR